ncbi:Sel1 domain protein repeat-containing protein [Pirellula staleyi DSM 6068]|uniref:Sel1 domain protein repeat-containing protein n=1 Tax=Pirellula staleyi (strain ATCC 27377 / DSM 6068 / ICPB 4128) TaxID=530564 RepID=D2R273_PIRSD|nr:tetratricopeptide repeat protein [Pirellula staleyi]ADB14982.1 Sel1 domain protein repeat-containing protein [Pirellula staleyi DSM 6068]
MTTNVKTMLTVIDSRESPSPRRCVEVALVILLISAYVIASGIVLQIADAQISTSIETLQELAHNGNAESQYELGRAYANGDSVAQDFRAAHRWFTRAAHKGHRPAQRALATMYTEGDGVPPDAEVAAHWLSLSKGKEAEVKTKRTVRVHKENESATEVSKGFELLALLERFIPDSDRVPRSWSTGTNEGLPIAWETQGVSSITAGEFASERVGTVVLTVRGEPTYKVLKKQVEPGKWRLRLLGAEYGYHAFELDEMEFTGATSAFGEQFIAEQLGDIAK